MNQRFIYSEKADLYLKGKLSVSERISFEERMQKDPLLQSEIKLQREVYQALGEARKAGLKARLDQIPVDQSPWFSGAPFKTAAIVSALVATSIATYITLKPAEEELAYRVSLSEPSHWQYSENTNTLKAPKPAVNTTVEATEVVPEPDEKTFVASNQAVVKNEAKQTPTIKRPQVVSDFSGDEIALDYSDFEVPQKQALQTNASIDTEIAIEKVEDQAHPFHYQFYNGKLFLHGDFQDAPYNIIALNTENGRKLFLKYAGAYYHLEEQEAISPLISITDSALILELRRLSITN